MKYRITAVSTEADVVKTAVDVEFASGDGMQLDVFHFQPADRTEIHLGIRNRVLTEKAKRQAIARIASMVPDISADIGIDAVVP